MNDLHIDLDSDEPDEIEAEIERCNDLLDFAQDRLKNGRFRNKETEKLRIQYIKAMSTVLRTKRSYLKDRELAEMAEMVAELEREMGQ